MFEIFQFDQLRFYGWTGDAQLRHRDRQLKAARTGASRIDIKDAAALRDRRLVRVPGDDDAQSHCRRVDVQLREVVQDIDAQGTEFENLGLRYGLRPGA